MNELGDLIKNNKAFFDNEEPFDDHFDRFEKKFTRARRFNFYSKSYRYLKVASVTLLIVISSVWVFERINTTSKNDAISLGEISPEYRDVEFYYTQLFNTKIEELKKVNTIDPELETDLLKKEFKDLDSLYQSLQKDLGYNNDDERIISAMIIYYQTKVEILSQIVNQLNEVKDNNTKREIKSHKKNI